jgi:hypothetical protein
MINNDPNSRWQLRMRLLAMNTQSAVGYAGHGNSVVERYCKAGSPVIEQTTTTNAIRGAVAMYGNPAVWISTSAKAGEEQCPRQETPPVDACGYRRIGRPRA